jgi:hypothetical protein
MFHFLGIKVKFYTLHFRSGRIGKDRETQDGGYLRDPELRDFIIIL